MKSFEDALAFMKTWDGTLDGRDRIRFAEFVPFHRAKDAGFELKDGATEKNWHKTLPWTEENVLNKLKKDALFGLEKADNERGISSYFMFGVVNMWCLLLENGLEQPNKQYESYGRSLFENVISHYGWDKE